MTRRPSLIVLIAAGLAGWLAVAALHDLAGALMRPLAPDFAWLFP